MCELGPATDLSDAQQSERPSVSGLTRGFSPPARTVMTCKKQHEKSFKFRLIASAGRATGKIIVMQQRCGIKIRPTYHLTNLLKDEAGDTE